MTRAIDHSLLPFAICQQRQLEVGYERSVKLRPGQILANRYLLGISTTQLSLNQAREIADQLKIPDIGPAMFWNLYSRANLLLIGFEDLEPGCVYKLYLEFDDQVVPVDDSDDECRLLHRGIKWNVDSAGDYRLSDYRWYPNLDAESLSRRIDRESQGLVCSQLVRSILRQALECVGADGLRYLRVVEGRRDSFDLNVYAAELRLNDVRELLESVLAEMSIGKDTAAAFRRVTKDAMLGHLAAGRDATGEEFLTIYFEPSA